MLLSEIAKFLNIEIHWSSEGSREDVQINRLSSIGDAQEGAISFLGDTKFKVHLESSNPSALIVKECLDEYPIPQLIHPDPHVAFAKLATLFDPIDHGEASVSVQAVIDPSASIGDQVTIHPFVVVAKGAKVGDRAVLYPGVYVGQDATIGADSVLYANTVVGARCEIGERNIIHANSVIGGDGFGFGVENGSILKIPQIGTARTGHDVELGACCTIDRAALEETFVDNGTKLDSHVHIGHNSQIGKNCMFSGATVVAGSTTVGDWCLAGGQTAIGGHIKIGRGVKIGAKSGVIKDVTDGETIMGFPAQSAMSWRRARVFERKMPDLDRKMKDLERRIKELEAK